MKKLILILSVVFSLSLLGACGHNEDEYKTVYEKVQNNEDLTESDYNLMLDYIDEVISATGKVKSQKQLEELEKKFPYAEKFMSELQYGEPSDELKSKLEKKAKKVYENYEKAQKELSKNLSSLTDEAGDEDNSDFDF